MDSPHELIALSVVVGGASIAAAVLLRRHLRSQIRRLGLERVGNAYRGVVDGLDVEVRTRDETSALWLFVQPFTSIEFIGPHPVSRFGQPLVLTGDDGFDPKVAACGDEAAIRGAFDGDTRAAIRRSGVVVRDGRLVCEFFSLEHAESIVRLAVSLHGRLDRTPDERLVQLEENARSDPRTAVRLRCVATLDRVPGGTVRVHALARDGSVDESVRLHAAIVAGLSDVVASIAMSTADGDRLAAATEALGSIGSPALANALDRVREVLRTSPNERLVRLLGRYGTVDDVRHLSAIEATALRWAVRDAIRAIQGRIVGADDGALAIAEAVGGEMAVADDGGLAVTRTEKADPPS